MSKKKDTTKKQSVWKFQILIFFMLFFSAEMILRVVGFRPGVSEDHVYFNDVVEHDAFLVGDEMGITHFAASGYYEGSEFINEEGFMSEIEFTQEAMDSLRKLGKKIVLLVGDSYTMGCCPDNESESFANLLGKSSEYAILNFGVGATDPLQYKLVVEKYLPKLNPDLVAVAVFLGNDIISFDRTPKPFVPICYPIVNGPWLSSEIPLYMDDPNKYHKNFDEALAYYHTHFSMHGKNRNFFEKILKSSVIFSKMYLKYELATRPNKPAKPYVCPEKPPFSYNSLKKIQEFCDRESTPVLFVGIPAPMDAEDQLDLRKKYAHLFNEIPWQATNEFSLKDYDGASTGNHFNTNGHAKYAKFLRPLIVDALKKEH